MALFFMFKNCYNNARKAYDFMKQQKYNVKDLTLAYFQKKSENLFALFLLSKSSVMRYFYFLAVLKELYCTKNILCSFQVHSSMLY